MMSATKMNRRAFMKRCGFGVAGASLLFNNFSAGEAVEEKVGTSSDKKEELSLQYRTLGKTGLKVSTVSFGVMRLKEPGVLKKALDLGINFFDTAHSYQNGNNERMLGKVLKEYGRQKVCVATKVHPFNKRKNAQEKYRSLEKKEIERKVEESLKRLQTDYADVLYLHNVMEQSWPLNQELLSLLDTLKKQGKARFVGVSLHDPKVYVEVVDQVIKAGVYDVLLASFNFKSPPEHSESLKKAKRANLGIVAMKTQAGGGYHQVATDSANPQQAALKWVLEKDYIDCAIPGMVNMEQLVENVAAAGKKMSWGDRKTLHTYYQSVKDRYCVMCGKCFTTCAKSVDINSINRALMYCEGYKDFALGRKTYSELNILENALSCVSCSSPTCHCVNGIKLASRMKYAHVLFA